MVISISHTWPKIGIQTQDAQLNLRNNGKTDHIISHTEPQIDITSTKSKVYIDQSQCFADAGLKGISDFANEYVQLGKQATMQYIQKRSQEGDSYANTQYGGRPILDNIANEMNQTLDYNIGLMPEHSPVIEIEPGVLDIQLIEGKVNVEYNKVPVDAEYVPYQVKVYMEQEGSLEIQFVGSNFDSKI